jgi:hypothetical protein
MLLSSENLREPAMLDRELPALQREPILDGIPPDVYHLNTLVVVAM